MNELLTLDENHIYRYNGVQVPGVNEVLNAVGASDFSKVPPTVLEAARKFGTAVHKACELWDKNDLAVDMLSAPLIPYLEAWKLFRKDHSVSYAPKEIEQKLFSKKWRFAGTLDRLPKLVSGKITLVDIKTPAELYPAAELQLGAYELLCDEQGIKTQERLVVHLTDAGTYKISLCKNRNDKLTFLSCLGYYNWLKSKNLR